MNNPPTPPTGERTTAERIARLITDRLHSEHQDISGVWIAETISRELERERQQVRDLLEQIATSVKRNAPHIADPPVRQMIDLIRRKAERALALLTEPQPGKEG